MLETGLLGLHAREIGHSRDHRRGTAGGKTRSGVRVADAAHLRSRAGRLVVREIRRGHGQLRAGTGHLGRRHVSSLPNHSASGSGLGGVAKENVAEWAATEAFPPGVADERVMVLHGSQQEEIEAAKNTDRSALLVSVGAARRVSNSKNPADEAAERRDEPADAGEDGANLLLSVVTDEDGEEGEARREEDHTEMEIRESEIGSGGESGGCIGVTGQLLSTIDEVASYVTASFLSAQSFDGRGKDPE